MSFFRKIIIIPILLIFGVASAQDFMIQGWYWDYPTQVGIQRWGQYYLQFIPALKQAGFTYIWLPPLSRAAGGRNSVGYDVQDYYDLGEYDLGPTCFGTRNDVNTIIDSLKDSGIHPVADIVFNQRAGGANEHNIPVQNYIGNLSNDRINAGYQPYPNDRVWAYILLDSATNGNGTYYIDIKSSSGNSEFFGFPYTFRAWTHKVPLYIDSLNDSYEYNPHYGLACGHIPGDSSNYYLLGTRKYCTVPNTSPCGTAEFRITLDTTMYDVSGDTLYISWTNSNTASLSNFSDHYPYGVYYVPSSDTDTSFNLSNQLVFITGTNFENMPSGKGPMNYLNFKPNGIDSTELAGDWDEMLFYYDVNQIPNNTKQVLSDYAEWMFDSVGIQGMRLDAVKNYSDTMVSDLLDTLGGHGHYPGLVVGEYYDGSPCDEAGYINEVEGFLPKNVSDSVHVRLFDFDLRFALKNACDTYGWDERQLFSNSIVDGSGGCGAISGYNVVTFCNNHDFRTDNGSLEDSIHNNPELAYAYMIGNNQLGIPCIFENDFISRPYETGRIRGLMNAHKKYIYGSNSRTYLNNYNSTYTTDFTNSSLASVLATTTIAFQLNNPRQVVVVINFAGDTLDFYQQLNMTSLAVGDTFTDIFGVTPDTLSTINSSNQLYIHNLPPRSFTIFVQGNLKDSLITLNDSILIQDTTSIDTTTKDTSGIVNVNPGGNIHVYPNPFSNQLSVQFNAAPSGNVSAEIFDEEGRMIYQEDFVAGLSAGFQFDPGITTPGVYILKISSGTDQHYFKLIKH